MMPTIGRLKTRPEFLKVAATGAKWVTPGLVLQMRQRPATPAPGPAEDTGPRQARVGFTVSRQVGNAIRRNRARRRLRAAAAEVLPEHSRAGCDYVLIGRAGTIERRYADLVTDLRTALARIGTKGSRRRPRRSGEVDGGKIRSGRGS